MEFGLERFLEAQDSGDFGITYEDAIKKLQEGQILTDGLWYIFPTLKEFGSSENDKLFGLSSIYAAYEYWAIPELCNRLKEATLTITRNKRGRTAEEILGEEGAKRLHSCVTLFDAVYPNVMFEEANDAFFEGKWDKETAKAMKKDWLDIHNDVWRKYKSNYPPRAFFDLACNETKRDSDGKKMTAKERYSTFLALVNLGYNVYLLALNYLVLGNWLGDEEREHWTSEALLHTFEALREDLKGWMEENHYESGLLDSLFPDMKLKIYSREFSWSQSAYMLDALSRFSVSYPALSAFSEAAIKENSQLTYIEPD